MSDEPQTILVLEDNEDDFFLMERALKRARIQNPVRVARDGNEAVDYLAGTGKFADRREYPLPALVFIDLKLPFVSGWQVFEWIRSHLPTRQPRVVILTSSSEPVDVQRARELGADAYMVKPPTADTLLRFETNIGYQWAKR